MSNSENCQSQSNDSGFVFGLVIGAIIGAVVAILIYKNNKTKVFNDLKIKLESFFQKFTNHSTPPKSGKIKHRTTPTKIPVVIPKKLIAKVSSTVPTATKSRKFIKPKK